MFQEMVAHYSSMPDLLHFLVLSFCLVILIHVVLLMAAKVLSFREEKGARKESFGTTFWELREHYYELTFSVTSILFFVGIYFSISFGIVTLPDGLKELWTQYEDFLLLGFILVSIIINNILDSLLIPLQIIEEESTINLRLAGMVYMFIIFAYIKFIYLDNNYDTIITYFVTLIIGRFVYFDASLEGFMDSVKGLLQTVPMMLIELLTTAVLAAYGFGTGYLLKQNGVVVSLTLAHLFVIFEIFVLDKLGIWSLFGRRRKRRTKAAAEEVAGEAVAEDADTVNTANGSAPTQTSNVSSDEREALKEQLRKELQAEMQERQMYEQMNHLDVTGKNYRK